MTPKKPRNLIADAYRQGLLRAVEIAQETALEYRKSWQKRYTDAVLCTGEEIGEAIKQEAERET